MSDKTIDLIAMLDNYSYRFSASFLRRLVFLLIFGALIPAIASCTPQMEDPQSETPTQQNTPQASSIEDSENTLSPLSPTFTPPANLAPQSASTSNDLEDVTSPADGKYLFVELWLNIDGEGNVPMARIDFPGYTFDPDTGILKQFRTREELLLSADDWGLIGNGQSRHGDAGGGISSQLTPLIGFPYTTSIPIFTGTVAQYTEEMRDGVVTLSTVSEEGLLSAIIDGEQVVLAPGESWVKEVAADIVTENFNGRYIIISTVTNYGWLDRTQITGSP